MIDQDQSLFGDKEEEPLFWFALADTQWNYGRLLPSVKEKALLFLSKEGELQRWKEHGERQWTEWKGTHNKLKRKLEAQQPPLKKVTKFKLCQCKWHLGDVLLISFLVACFAYQFSSSYSVDKGFYGRYFSFRKISEDTWWPGHVIPVIQIYGLISDQLLTVDQLMGTDLLSIIYPNKSQGHCIKLISESNRSVPLSNLTYLGNQIEDDLIPFRDHNYWTGYYPVGWESSKYNTKIEHFVINMYLDWNN